MVRSSKYNKLLASGTSWSALFLAKLRIRLIPTGLQGSPWGRPRVCVIGWGQTELANVTHLLCCVHWSARRRAILWGIPILSKVLRTRDVSHESKALAKSRAATQPKSSAGNSTSYETRRETTSGPPTPVAVNKVLSCCNLMRPHIR